MRLQEEDARRGGSAEPAAFAGAGVLAGAGGFFVKTLAIAELEVRKLRHDFSELLTRAVQPILWLVLFGGVLSRAQLIPTGGLPYLDFITPGILGQSALFVSIFYGVGILWERDLGITNKFLVSPTPRSALVLGKALSAGVRALSQAVIIYAVALALGVRLDWNPAALAGVLLAVALGAALFATFSLIVACLVKTRERFMGIGQLLTMPLFFASNAIYPIDLMPGWLRVISRINPLSYEVDALRALMLRDGVSAFGLTTDYAVLLAVTAVLVAVGAYLYPRVIL
ncbi:MAG TPA: ABC transporter permease [Pyrinomonadaceae bacterium]|nr:ABC transporter permease [Pyrinomonadaceae bacterium]